MLELTGETDWGFVRIQGAAFAAFRDKELGVLKPGAYADLVVLSENPLALSKQDVSWSKHVDVLKTFVGGKCVSGCGDI